MRYPLHTHMNLFKRIYIWCKRFRYRKGYGVHSPFAFSLITEVIYEKSPYYAYDELRSLRKERNSKLPGYCLRVDKLLFRLVNRFRPESILEVGTGTGVSLCYLAAARLDARCVTISEEMNDDSVTTLIDHCKNATIVQGNTLQSVQEELNLFSTVDLVHIAHTREYKAVFEMCLPHLTEESLVIVEGIYDTDEKRTWWQQIVADQRTGITFDLYDMGLVFFNLKMNKQHYVVNF